MSIKNDWLHKDVWKREGKDFCVEVSRHTVPTLDEGSGYDAEGCNNWCIYGYVYPKHPMFSRFDPDAGMWDQPTPPMHGGCTYFKAHRKGDGSITSFQFGCDYKHLGDWMFTQMATKDDAYSVFRDADDLFGWLAGKESE